MTTKKSFATCSLKGRLFLTVTPNNYSALLGVIEEFMTFILATHEFNNKHEIFRNLL